MRLGIKQNSCVKKFFNNFFSYFQKKALKRKNFKRKGFFAYITKVSAMDIIPTIQQ